MEIGHTENGIASWYGNPYHGRQAANGEVYDMEKMTAAHRTMPFNTWVRVHDLDNGKITEVRITDRGPFVGGRIIDLSRAAARELAMIGPGTARVRVEVIPAPAVAPATLPPVVTSSPPPAVTPPEPVPAAELPPAAFAVQVGAFRERGNAEGIRATMETRYGTARIVERQGNPTTWRVLVGSEPTEESANALAAKIRQESVEKIACFVVRLDII